MCKKGGRNVKKYILMDFTERLQNTNANNIKRDGRQ